MAEALLVRVAFPRAAYSGAELGTPEELPSPARIHAAFVAAAAGGPHARVEGRVLRAQDRHRTAVRWLEDHEPLGVAGPTLRSTSYGARRYRYRAAVGHANETDFEPFSALDGPVTYAWPEPSEEVVEGLRELAPEITHVGRADGTAIVKVALGAFDLEAQDVLARAMGRGPGRPLRVARTGRFDALASAHLQASKAGHHSSGTRSVQASDQPVPSAGEEATVLRRFAPAVARGSWAFSEAWRVELRGAVPRWALRLDRRVAVAVAIHRAVVAAIAADVPAFVSGRDGDGPLRGPGHLAIHPVPASGGLSVILGLPSGVPEADRATLLDALGARPKVRLAARTVRLGTPAISPALPFWPGEGALMVTAVPMVLDNAGGPRRGSWTLDDAVICSVGYALRGVLEEAGMEWGTGWSFRQALVGKLRDRGVRARARRVPRGAAQFAHRAPRDQLLVAVEALVNLGDLASTPGGLLALGRSRHLGGGLLAPVDVDRP